MNHNPNNDAEVQNAAEDGISCVAWAGLKPPHCWVMGQSDPMLGGAAKRQAARKLQHHTRGQRLRGVEYDGARVFTGSCDKTAKVWTWQRPRPRRLQHDQPIKNIFWVPELNRIGDALWDKTVVLGWQDGHPDRDLAAA